MSRTPTTTVVLTFRPTRRAVAVSLLGAAALTGGFLLPAGAATPALEDGPADYVCVYIGKGGTGGLKKEHNPEYIDTAATQPGWITGEGGRPAYVLVADTGVLEPAPTRADCPPSVPGSTGTSTHGQGGGGHQTGGGGGGHDTGGGHETTGTTTSTTTTTTTTTASTTTASTTTSPVTTTTTPAVPVPVAPAESSTAADAETPATQAPAVVPGPTAAPEPSAAPNAVPLAATDGADLLGQGSVDLRMPLLGGGLVLLVSGGLLSVHRRETDPQG